MTRLAALVDVVVEFATRITRATNGSMIRLLQDLQARRRLGDTPYALLKAVVKLDGLL